MLEANSPLLPTLVECGEWVEGVTTKDPDPESRRLAASLKASGALAAAVQTIARTTTKRVAGDIVGGSLGYFDLGLAT